jgi:hypothetical protein
MEPYSRFDSLVASAYPTAHARRNPAFWLPGKLDTLRNANKAALRAVKTAEPQITGMVWTDCSVYLVLAVFHATLGHVAKLMLCRSLMADDPDYAEHRGKRVYCLLLCDDSPLDVIHFALVADVRIITRVADAPVDAND